MTGDKNGRVGAGRGTKKALHVQRRHSTRFSRDNRGYSGIFVTRPRLFKAVINHYKQGYGQNLVEHEIPIKQKVEALRFNLITAFDTSSSLHSIQPMEALR